MLKIAHVTIKGHPILGDLELDFRAPDGSAVDTVIIAGENGVGKSTVMGLLYGLVSGDAEGPIGTVELEFDRDEAQVKLEYKMVQSGTRDLLYVVDSSCGKECWIKSSEFKSAYPMSAIYSDVDINFHSKRVSSVTSMTLDSVAESRKSSGDLPTEINQLLIDVQALDDADVAYAARNNRGRSLDDLHVEERMPRFTSAFERMFEDLRYDRIDNKGGHKEIVFKKYGREVPIEALSSGEKQVVYRGCFLLKDANATKGAFVFIDEPEISLHPDWQKRVMDYYKAMFTDASGRQTSQIFCVTHSPFVVHKENRCNDKVVVLARDEEGRVVAKDRPEYYRCDSLVVIEDAFDFSGFVEEASTVYVEGPTDERYFTRAAEVFGYASKLTFRCVGKSTEGGGKGTGCNNLKHAAEFLANRGFNFKNACIFDCDVSKIPEDSGAVHVVRMENHSNAKLISRGIENALILDDVDMDPFYSSKEIIGDYGEKKTIPEFNKTSFCHYICSLEDESLKGIFANLRPILDELVDYFEN